MRIGPSEFHEPIGRAGVANVHGTRHVEPLAFLTDFGLAKSIATGSKLTRTGVALGTPSYMSPEQACGEASALTPATDVWSLGVVLYEMLAGRPPWRSDTAAGVVGKVLLEDPPPLASVGPPPPAPVERVVIACLGKRAAGRYPDAAALRLDFARLLRGERPRTRPPRRPGLRALAAAAALGTGLAFAVGLGRGTRVVPGSLAGDQATSESEARAQRARAIRSSDPLQAEELLAGALSMEPARHDWRLERGLLLWALGRSDRALAEWSRVPDGAPEATRARLFSGLEAMFRLEGTAARARLQVLESHPGPEGCVARGALAAIGGDWPAARASLADLAGWEAALLRAYVETQGPTRDAAAAVREYTTALDQGIAFAWALTNRALALRRLGDDAAALADFDAAIRLVPDHTEARNGRGNLRAVREDFGGALEDYDVAIRSAPDSFRPLHNRARLHSDRGDLRAALADLDEAVQLGPEESKVWQARGDTRRRAGDLRGALEDYDVAIRLAPDEIPLLTGRAAIRRDAGDPAGSLEDCERVLRLRPDDPRGLMDRGLSHQLLGDLDAALQDFEASLRLRPDYAEALTNRGTIRVLRADLSGAIADFDRSLRLLPGNAETLGNRGEAKRRLGDLAGARADLEGAIRMRPENPLPHANRGLLCRHLGEWREAAVSFREFLRLAPGHPEAARIERYLRDVEEKARAER
ncbi:MAG: tetratricopeptide repeat protein [Planctomycetales bacterium]|nr:tetratricopeptide repeat protein [Planctomycetales bacterium]